MLDQKNGSSYLTSDAPEQTSSGGGQKSRYIYPDKNMITQAFVLMPDQGEWSPYAPQTVRYHGGAISIHTTGEEDKGPRKIRVNCKGRECPVCRDLDRRYPQLKDQPFTESRRHSKLFLLVPLQFSRGKYTVNQGEQIMQVEYNFRYDSTIRDSINIEWKDLSQAIKSVMDRGIDPFDMQNAVVFERNRESEPNATGSGVRKIWRHKAIEIDSTKKLMTIEMPGNLLDHVKKHFPLEGYARDLGIPDLHRLVDAGRAQKEIMESLAEASSSERQSLMDAMADINTQLQREMDDVALKTWLENAEKYAASRSHPADMSQDRGTEESESAPVQAPLKPVAKMSTPVVVPAAVVAPPVEGAQADQVAKPAVSAADAVRAKYGLRK